MKLRSMLQEPVWVPNLEPKVGILTQQPQKPRSKFRALGLDVIV